MPRPPHEPTITRCNGRADGNRQDIIYTRGQLLAPLLPGMEQPPRPMRLGENEQDYCVQGPELARRKDAKDPVGEQVG